MKARFSLLFCVLTLSNVLCAITKNDAYEVVKSLYPGCDYDYYLVEDNDTGVWKFFVDAAPLKGWEHECYLISLPKSSNAATVVPDVTSLSMPPSATLTPMANVNRYGANALEKPMLPDKSQSNGINPVAGRTYAIIVSGGANKNANYERYWNDCSFIYQTLVKTYGIPKSNIYVLMSDGTNPGEDMLLTTGGYTSSPLDLDGDGLADIGYAATRTNINNVLQDLSLKLSQDDHLFFYVIDHGGSDDKVENSYIWLWNNEKLYDYELGEWMKPFVNKDVTINFVLGQCYSGGFLRELVKEGCVVTTACSGSEPSWSCPDRPYDEFVYHWTSAVNKRDTYGNEVSAEIDGNGIVSMHEAYIYALNSDRRNESPQFWGYTSTVGLLAFDHLIPSVGLYIKDNWYDFGMEPNTSTDNFWDSPYIWVRNFADSIHEYEHENPFYTDDHPTAFVYVKVQNYGKKTYPGRGKYLHTHWAKASTAITIGDWNGRTTNPEKTYKLGYPIESRHISNVIAPGESANVVFTWNLQPTFGLVTESIDGSRQHVCLLAMIRDSFMGDEGADGKDSLTYDVIGNCGIAQKNLSIIPAYQTPYGTRAFVKNISNVPCAYSLEFTPRTDYDAEIFEHASVEMELSPRIYNAWRRGGSQLKGARAKSFSVTNPDNFVVELLSTNSKVDGVRLSGQEMDAVTMKFAFINPTSEIQVYTYDLIQRDESGKIVGGETFKIVSPTSSANEVQVSKEPLGASGYKLSAEDGFKSYVWRNADGEKLGIGESMIVGRPSENDSYTVTGITSDGEMAATTVSLSPRYGIESVRCNDGTGCNEVEVKLKTASPTNSILTISSISNGRVLHSENCEEGVIVHNISIDDPTGGIILVAYSIDGVVVDTRKVEVRY